MKQGGVSREEKFEDITMPKNTGAGIFIAGFALAFGFAVIWHIWWLAVLGLLGIFLSILVRTFTEDTEYVLAAAEVREQEMLRHKTI
jgi:cytochrome o ubiquinol oxidase subunit 1